LLGPNRDDELLRTNWTTFWKALPTARGIAIAGGGPTSVDITGELDEFFNGRAGWFSSKLANPKVPITCRERRIKDSTRPPTRHREESRGISRQSLRNRRQERASQDWRHMAPGQTAPRPRQRCHLRMGRR
jgi:hypothetical protein